MLIVAHRGLHGSAPENSLAAIDAALAHRISHIEVDVRATADGQLVLLHDATLGRTTNADGMLSALHSSELSRVRLSDGSLLPRLDQVLERCRGQAVLCLDVKDPRLAGDVCHLAERSGAGVEVWSVHRDVVAHTADRGLFAAWISHGVLPPGGVAALTDEARQLGASALSFYPADVTTTITAVCHAAGLAVMSGTPNDRPTWAYLNRLGLRAVITDQPLRARRWLDSVRGLPPLAQWV